MYISKAIIPVAGWGTRRMPITKAIEKCMLPIGNRPLVDYVVRDCLLAGIRDIYFVVSGENTQLEAYYSDNPALRSHLERHNHLDLLAVASPMKDVQFHFVQQPSNGKYGTSIPVELAAPYIAEGESVVVLMGDDFIYNSDGSSEVARLIAATPEGGNSMLGFNVSREQVGHYGVLRLNENNEYIEIVEKPSIDKAPSTLINISKYVFNYDLIKTITNHSSIELSGEYGIVDPMNQYVANGGSIKVVQAVGQYLDGGTVDGWLEANNIIAKNGWR